MTPVWEKLAEKYEANPGVVIATVDGTRNEISEVNVFGFPTFVLFPSGSEKKVCRTRILDHLIKLLVQRT